ncbi:MAG: glutamate--tRNA ligase, partial [Burkholderiaceae bacterium]
MILGPDGEKLSKRHGAVSVMEYPAQGILPEAMVNYLARLGWSHGNDEIFSVEQLCEWFDLDHLTKSPAQFDVEKLRWLNAHYIKQATNDRLAALARPRMVATGADFAQGPDLDAVAGLLKERASTVNELADAAMLFYREPSYDAAAFGATLDEPVKNALRDYAARCETVDWARAALTAMLKEVLAAHDLKMPQLAMPLRVVLTGQTQTPAIDAVVELLGRDRVMARLRDAWKIF